MKTMLRSIFVEKIQIILFPQIFFIEKLYSERIQQLRTYMLQYSKAYCKHFQSVLFAIHTMEYLREIIYNILLKAVFLLFCVVVLQNCTEMQRREFHFVLGARKKENVLGIQAQFLLKNIFQLAKNVCYYVYIYLFSLLYLYYYIYMFSLKISL